MPQSLSSLSDAERQGTELANAGRFAEDTHVIRLKAGSRPFNGEDGILSPKISSDVRVMPGSGSETWLVGSREALGRMRNRIKAGEGAFAKVHYVCLAAMDRLNTLGPMINNIFSIGCVRQ